MTPQKPAAILDRAQIRAELHKHGWTFHPVWRDNDPQLPIVGVRLTNCEKIFESAQTIQFFDTSTVTVQFGFLQEQSVTLTREDGAEFIEWFAQAHPDLAAPMLATVPPGDRGPGPSISPMSTAKGDLVKYLADTWPEIFGRGGKATQPGADFYAEVLQLLKVPQDPQRDQHAIHVRTLLAAENMAHDFYANANALLRTAARATGSPIEFQMDAYAQIRAAEAARAYADNIRALLPLELKLKPLGGEFPEAIDAGSIYAVQSVRELLAAAVPPPRKVEHHTPYAGDTLKGKDIKKGYMVGVIDPNHPKFRQMGQVVAPQGDDAWFVLVSGETAAECFKPEQLMKL